MWFRVDDDLHDHEKAAAAGLEAMGAWTLAGSWSGKRGTDGLIPIAVALKIAPLRVWKRLLDAKAGHVHGLVEEREGGFQLHDFLDRNPSAAMVEAERLRKAKNIQDHRQRRRAGVRPETEEETGPVTGYSDGYEPRSNHGPDPDPVPRKEKSSGGVDLVPGSTSSSPDAPSRDESPEAQTAAADDPPRSLPTADPAWLTWRKAYTAKHGPLPYDPKRSDKAIAEAMRSARTTVAEHHPDLDPTDGPRMLFAHWVTCYLADPGNRGWLDENKHPVEHLTRDIAKYGTPWDKRPAIAGPGPSPAPRIPTEAEMAERTAELEREAECRAADRHAHRVAWGRG